MHKKRCPTLHNTAKKGSLVHRDSMFCLSDWARFKKMIILSADEDAGEMALLCIAGGRVNWGNLLEGATYNNSSQNTPSLLPSTSSSQTGSTQKSTQWGAVYKYMKNWIQAKSLGKWLNKLLHVILSSIQKKEGHLCGLTENHLRDSG